jgi:hypothetical protein
MYVKSKWLLKTEMWVVGNRNLPYVGQDTNVAIKNYHANLKTTFHSSKGRFHERHVDWVMHVFGGDILLHYWYIALWENNGFVMNRNMNN